MESSSKQNRNRKQKKGQKFTTLEDWELKQWQKHGIRNWADLPPDLMAMILMRLSAVEIFETAQLVCSSWRRICKDPLVWKSIHMNNLDPECYSNNCCEQMTRNAVDMSCGLLTDISIKSFATEELLHYIADRSPQLTRLRLDSCDAVSGKGLLEVVVKLSGLTYIDLTLCMNLEGSVEAIGRCCPLLKSFAYNNVARRYFGYESEDETDFESDADYPNAEAFAIAANMPGLHNLALVGNALTNVGLRAILDGCPHLVSLDIRRCHNISLDGDLEERCRDQIKDLRGPSDSISDYPYRADRNCFCINCDNRYGYSVDNSSVEFLAFDDDDDDDGYNDNYGYLSNKYF